MASGLPDLLQNRGKGSKIGSSISGTGLENNDPEYSLEGLKLKLQYFGHLMQKAESLEKTLMLGKIEGKRRRATEDEMVGWHNRPNGHEFEQTPGHSEGQAPLACCSP